MLTLRALIRPPALRTASRCLATTPRQYSSNFLHPRAPLHRKLFQNFPNRTIRSLQHARFFSQTPRSPLPSEPYNPRDPNHQRLYHEYRLSNARPLITNNGLWRIAKSRGTHTVIVAAFIAAVSFYFYNIQTVPVSGRKRFNCYSDHYVEKVSAEQVKRIIHEVESAGGSFLPSWDPRSQMVARVMRRLIPVSGLEGQEWEVRVIDDPHTLNAFVLPGGKVFVHSGILRITRNEHGLAAVLGHEIAHNLAQHVGERMSSTIGPNILLGSLVLLAGWFPPAFMLVQYLGSGVMDFFFMRPMGRLQESEADYIGLMLMAEACFDPREALALWQRMDMAAKRAQGDEIPEILSTHPSNEHRVDKFREWMPKALEKWDASDCKGTATFANMFRRALDRGNMIVEF